MPPFKTMQDLMVRLAASLQTAILLLLICLMFLGGLVMVRLLAICWKHLDQWLRRKPPGRSGAGRAWEVSAERIEVEPPDDAEDER